MSKISKLSQVCEDSNNIQKTTLGEFFTGELKSAWDGLSKWSKKDILQKVSIDLEDIEDGDVEAVKINNRSPLLKDDKQMLFFIKGNKVDIYKGGKALHTAEYGGDKKSWKDVIDGADSIYALDVTKVKSTADIRQQRKAARAGIPDKASYGADKSGYRSEIGGRLADYKTDKRNSALGEIDTKELEDSLSKAIGQQLTFKSDKSSYGGKMSKAERTEVSAEVKLTDPVMKLMFKKLEVSAKLYGNTDGSVAGDIHFWYEHPGGGSNGIEIARASYKDGKWDIRYKS